MIFRTTFLLLIIIIAPVLAFATNNEISEQDFFSMAVVTYEQNSFSVSLDLFEKFLRKYPESKLRFEAQLYIAQCQFQRNKFLEARNALTHLEQSFVPFSIEDRLLFWSGRVYLKAQDYPNAAKYLRRLIKDHPESDLVYPAQLQLAKVLSLDGNLQAAQGVYEQLLSSRNLTIQEEALFERGFLFYEAQRYEKAIKDFTLFCEAFLDSQRLPDVYFYLGESYFYRNDFSKATEYYRQALEQTGRDSLKKLCFLGIGWSSLRLNKLKDAEAALLEIEDSRISDFDFDNESFISAKALLYLRMKDFRKAVSYYDKIIAMNLSVESLIHALFGKAESLKGLSRIKKTRKIYLQIVSYEDQTQDEEALSVIAKTQYHLGEIFLKTKETDLALHAFEKAASLLRDKDDLRLSALFQIAAIHYDSGALTHASDIYSQIQTDYPNNAYSDYVQYQLGLLSLQSGSFDAAIALFLEFNKRYDRSDFLDDVNYYLGSAYFQSGQFAAASKRLNNFLSVFLDSAYRDDALYLLAVSFYKQGQFKKALDSFEHVLLRLDAHDGLVEKIEYEIAHTLYQMGQEAKAIDKFNEFIRQYPHSSLVPRIILWLGQYRYRNRQFNLSRKNFETVIRRFASDALTFEAHYQIGLTFLAEEKYLDAMRSFKRLLNRCKTKTQKAKVLLIMGDVLTMQGEQQEAIERYKELTQLVSFNSISVVAHDELEAQASKGVASRFTEDRNKIIVDDFVNGELLSEDDSARYVRVAFVRLGEYYKQNAQFAKAISSYKQALLFPTQKLRAQIQFKIAESQEENSNREGALETYSSIAHVGDEDIPWVVKGLLRSAALYEERKDLRKAIEHYEKIRDFDVEEARFAQERIELLKKSKI